MSGNACLWNNIRECTSHLEHVLTHVGSYLQNLLNVSGWFVYHIWLCNSACRGIKLVVECPFLCPDNYWRNTRQGTNITVPVVSSIIGHNVLMLTLLHHCYLLLDGGDVITWIKSERTTKRVYTEDKMIYNNKIFKVFYFRKQRLTNLKQLFQRAM